MPPNHGDPVAPDVTVTQFGKVESKSSGNWCRPRFQFQRRLRDEDETGVSCFVGRLTIDEAAWRVTLEVRHGQPGDAVRYTTAGELVAVGFTVTHVPTTCVEHIEVQWEGPWDDDVGNRFDDCFHEYLR